METSLTRAAKKLTDDLLLAMIEYIEGLQYTYANSKILESLNRELSNR